MAIADVPATFDDDVGTFRHQPSSRR
jgi:hypothetical protein